MFFACGISINPTGEKHTISTFVDQTPIQLTRQCVKPEFFFFKNGLPKLKHHCFAFDRMTVEFSSLKLFLNVLFVFFAVCFSFALSEISGQQLIKVILTTVVLH